MPLSPHRAGVRILAAVAGIAVALPLAGCSKSDFDLRDGRLMKLVNTLTANVATQVAVTGSDTLEGRQAAYLAALAEQVDSPPTPLPNPFRVTGGGQVVIFSVSPDYTTAAMSTDGMCAVFPLPTSSAAPSQAGGTAAAGEAGPDATCLPTPPSPAE